MAQRRLRGEPIAYILGYKDFYGLGFKVDKNVLIPRPETEMVVDLVTAKLRSLPSCQGGVPSEARRGGWSNVDSGANPSVPINRDTFPWQGRRLRGIPIKILDLGTGSGCIIISLAKLMGTIWRPPDGAHQGNRRIEFYASDISSAALKIARQNAQKHHVKIKFTQSDLLKNIKQDFGIIIANLPYLAPGWKSAELKFEPKQALFAKEKGLMIIRKLLEQIAALKHQPRLVYLEFDPRQKPQLLSLIKKSLPGSIVKFYKDYNNFWRYVEIK